jgi:hypothetical protein
MKQAAATERGPSRVSVELSRHTPEPSRSWDAAHRLGLELSRRNPRLEQITVAIHANRRELLRWRITNRAHLAVHWALAVHTERVIAVVEGNQQTWEELVALLPAAPLPRLAPRGRVYDLGPLLADQHVHLPQTLRVDLAGEVRRAHVTWGRFAGRPPRRVLRLGSCDGGAPPVIRIHPVLDHDSVPGWFVGFVLFHELLHVALPPVVSGGRRLVHPPSFRRAERAHPDYHRALDWESKHVPTLLARCHSMARAAG